ncbi:MAG: aminoacyl-tRNA hydrolase [Thermoanaerobaculum sp.]|nr:aminoacyl-tRNA hydrolase [Thermoanaerobaculum sp.]MCX7895176.1 aminoacyl-tRNA hydrolase [Thermoanaerobaculum sp.]MDW7968668.1 aminoacyl-tRNA hydrolase [Thermoanaerobaculum sp.]
MDVAAVVGLGNPGAQYERSRHNVGFMVVDALVYRWRCGPLERRSYGWVGQRTRPRPLWLMKPCTYMNLSGTAVAALCRDAGLRSQQVLVVVDDVDLPLGQLRLRRRGGAGTHNGLRSVVEAVGESFPRLRLGVRGATPWEDLAEYVLAPFAPEEEVAVREMIERAVACVEEAIFSSFDQAANRFNVRTSA